MERPAFHVELGALNAALALNALRLEFGIESNRATASCSRSAKRACASSKRSGRAIRSRASCWTVPLHGRWKSVTACAPRHRSGPGRSGATLEIKDAEDAALSAFVADPNTEKRLNEAGVLIAKKIGNNMDGETVVDRVDLTAANSPISKPCTSSSGQILAIAPKRSASSPALIVRSRVIADELSRVRTLLRPDRILRRHLRAARAPAGRHRQIGRSGARLYRHDLRPARRPPSKHDAVGADSRRLAPDRK